MSRAIGDQLPESILALVDGAHINKRVGFTALLLTTGADGWVSIALLSAGEILATDRSSIRLALWPRTAATANLARDARATIGIVDNGNAYYVRASFRRGEDLQTRGANYAFFVGRVVQVLEDRVTYAQLTSGVTFEIPERDRVLRRWRATVDAMRAVQDLSQADKEPGTR